MAIPLPCVCKEWSEARCCARQQRADYHRILFEDAAASRRRPLQKSEFRSFRRNEVKVARHLSAGKFTGEAGVL